MNLQTIHEHTVDLDLLSGGICIDVGCRGFQFSEAMRDLGLKVHAYDIEIMEAPIGVYFQKLAITHANGNVFFIDTMDNQAKYISEVGVHPVESMSLNQLYKVLALESPLQIDLLKMDVEGSEYGILSDPNFQPIPKQISVEMHMHCHRALHDQYYDKCMENLLKWYEPVQHELTQAHGAGWNY